MRARGGGEGLGRVNPHRGLLKDTPKPQGMQPDRSAPAMPLPKPPGYPHPLPRTPIPAAPPQRGLGCPGSEDGC